MSPGLPALGSKGLQIIDSYKKMVVAHEILVTAPEAKFPSPLLDLTGTGTWPQACQ